MSWRARHSCIYHGHVMHARGGPHANTFRYRHGFLLVDLDELPELERRLRPLSLPLFGWRRRALVRIDERDWMRTPDAPASDLRHDVVEWARRRGAVSEPVRRVQLACMPRQLGSGFNPISIFYLTLGEAAEPSVAVVEVHNTFGEPHRYLAAVGDDRTHHPKQLHVSPFLSMQGGYRMRIAPPGPRFVVRIDLEGAGVPFTATWTGRRRDLTVGSLLRMVARFPFGPRLVVARIHLQALRLWALRRAPLHRKPPYRPGLGTVTDDGAVNPVDQRRQGPAA